MEIKIRKANIRDIVSIYSLVKELAIYEHAAEEVTATIDEYLTDFKNNCFESLVATHNDEVIGMMLYYMTYSTWKGKMLYLEDFVVNKNYRKQGIGQQLFNALKLIAKEKDARLIKWQVIDWNEPAVNFYLKNNAQIEKNWWNVKISINN